MFVNLRGLTETKKKKSHCINQALFLQKVPSENTVFSFKKPGGGGGGDAMNISTGNMFGVDASNKGHLNQCND